MTIRKVIAALKNLVHGSNDEEETETVYVDDEEIAVSSLSTLKDVEKPPPDPRCS